MKCENCKNQYASYVCEQIGVDIQKRVPCEKFKEYPKGLTPKGLIDLLKTMPQDKEIVVDTEGLFAVIGCIVEDKEDKYIYLSTELISW